MDLESLNTLVAVARTGSFAAHARDAGVDPSSISRVVANLERELGVRLFERTTRRLDLTEAGRLYLDRIAPLLEELEGATDAVRDVATEPAGRLRVTASVAFGERWLLPHMAGFRERFPRIELDLLLTDAVLDLAGESVDIGIRLGQRVTGSLIATKLFDSRYRIVASPSYLERAGRLRVPADLSGRDCVVFPYVGFRSLWRLRQRKGGAIEEVVPRVALTVSNALAIRRAALDGFGVAMLAEWTVESDLRRGTLVDLFPAHDASATDFESAAWIVYPSRAYTPARVRAFVDYLKSVA